MDNVALKKHLVAEMDKILDLVNAHIPTEEQESFLQDLQILIQSDIDDLK